MTVQNWIGAIAGICALAGFIPYWLAIWQGKTRPNRATWWIWSIVGLIIALSYQATGAGSTLWVSITYTIGPLGTSLLALKFGEGGWTKFDRICLLGAGVSLVIWGLTRSPSIALAMNIGIDLLGALPTIRKSFYHPEGENTLAWSLFVLATTLNLLAIDRWEWQIMIYPIYMFLVTFSIFSVLWHGRRRQKSI